MTFKSGILKQASTFCCSWPISFRSGGEVNAI